MNDGPDEDCDVALKILPENTASDSRSRGRLEREAKVVAALSHPNILAIHDFGTEGGVSFVVTELLDGETLRGRVDHARILAHAGEVDAALERIEDLVSCPSRLSPAILRLDPGWDPLRKIPRFQEISG